MKIVHAIWNFFRIIFGPVGRFLGWFVKPLFTTSDKTEMRQAQLLATITLAFGLFNVVGIFATAQTTQSNASAGVLSALTAATLLGYGFSRTRNYRLGANIFIGAWVIGAFANAANTAGSPVGSINVILSFVFIMAGTLISLRALGILSASALVMIFLTPLFIPRITPPEVFSVAGTSGTLIVLVLIFTAFRNAQEKFRLEEVKLANVALEAANKELNDIRQTLEERVEQRTAELSVRSEELEKRSTELENANTKNQRRAFQFQALAEVARAIASVETLDQLLPSIARVISDQFDFYHVGIFLADEANEYAVLAATNSEGGQRMLRRGHRLKIGAVGIVGNVVGSGKPRIALDTGADAVYFQNPDLPETRSEMALPLQTGNIIIGALDVQSTAPDAFSEDDVALLTVLADQVSIAIQNARQFEATQKALSEAEAIYRQYLRTEWSRLTQRQDVTGYSYSLLGTRQIPSTYATEETRQALERGEMQVVTSENASAMALPIKLRDEIIGVLNVRAPAGHTWNENEIDLVQAVAERVALSAENARLFEETTSRAERERIVADITNKIRSTNDPEVMLQTALAELQRALNVSKVQIVPFRNGGNGNP